MYDFDWGFVFDHLPRMLLAVGLDLEAAVAGFLIGSLLGLFLALMRLSRTALLRAPAAAYTVFVSSVPHYVLLLWIYFGLATAVGLALSPVAAIVTSVSLIASAYTSETFRAGILAIDRGQFEAARALGMSEPSLLRDIVLPQAFRSMLPPLGNIFIMVLKGATIMSIISAPDIVFVAQDLNLRYFRPFETYTAVAAILIFVVLCCTALIALAERALKLP
jgi:His/Glu/Gln/Arg/opine family amino acid ABC transporter permease subunit